MGRGDILREGGIRKPNLEMQATQEGDNLLVQATQEDGYAHTEAGQYFTEVSSRKGDEILGLVRGMQDLKMQAIQEDGYNQVEAGQNPNKVSSRKGEEEHFLVIGMQNLKMQAIQEGEEENYSEG